MITNKKYAAYIWPVEDYKDKEKCVCFLKWLNGPEKGRIIQTELSTSIFKYYFWGVTLEFVELNAWNDIVSVYDIKQGNDKDFGIIHILSWNSETTEMLGSDGFVYRLDQSPFARECKPVYEYIRQHIESTKNFAMYVYLYKGAPAAVLYDPDLSPDSKNYKRAVHRGFITSDNSILRSIKPDNFSVRLLPGDENEKMKQEDIDRLIIEMSGEIGF